MVLRSVERKIEALFEGVFGRAHTDAQEAEWMKAQGPYSSALLRYLPENADRPLSAATAC